MHDYKDTILLISKYDVINNYDIQNYYYYTLTKLHKINLFNYRKISINCNSFIILLKILCPNYIWLKMKWIQTTIKGVITTEYNDVTQFENF